MNDHPLIIAMGKALLAMLGLCAMIGVGVSIAILIGWWPWIGILLFAILIFTGFTLVFLRG